MPEPKYVERSSLLQKAKSLQGDLFAVPLILDAIEYAPTADVVSREVFEQFKWERDTALQTLQEHGIGLGEKADVEEVVICRDCKHRYTPYDCALWYGTVNETEYFIERGDDFYCSFGEKKEGAEE